MASSLKMKFGEEDTEQHIQDVVTDYANFMKERSTTEFLNKWKGKGYKKVGVTELLFKLWLLGGSKKSSKALLSEASELLEKLSGGGGWFSFLGDLKLTPERSQKKV